MARPVNKSTTRRTRVGPRLAEGTLIERVMRLRPKAYEYRPEFHDDNGPLPTGLQYGFIAQQVERIFPALVAEVNVDEQSPGGRTRRKRIKAINYQGFIAILIAVFQEQQRELRRLGKLAAKNMKDAQGAKKRGRKT